MHLTAVLCGGRCVTADSYVDETTLPLPETGCKRATVHVLSVCVVLCVSWLHGELSAVVQLPFTAVGVSVGTAITLPRAAFPGTMYRPAFVRVHIYGKALPSDKALVLWLVALLVNVFRSIKLNSEFSCESTSSLLY